MTDRLFNKRFLRRSKADSWPAIGGALEAPFALRFDHADDDMVVGTVERSCKIPTNYVGLAFIYDILVVLEEAFTLAGTALVDLGDTTDPNGYLAGLDVEDAGAIIDAGDYVSVFRNASGTIASFTGAYLEADRAVAGAYTAPDDLTATLTITGAVPSAGRLYIVPLFIVPTMLVNG